MPDVDFRLALSALILPLVLVAIAAVLAPRIRSAVLALGVALLGFATAVGASHLAVATVGPADIALWTGAGLSLAWLGLVLAAVVALDAMRRGPALLGFVALAGVLAAILPTAVGLATDRVAIAPAAERTLPAFVAAEAENDSRVTTMRLTPDTDGSLRATLERGRGVTLDEQSTLADTAETLSAEEEQLAEIAGNLASRSGFDPDAAIREFGVSFVLLDAPSDDAERAEVATAERARSALDGNAALIAVGETDFGVLWRFVDAQPDAPAAQIPADAGGWQAVLITVIQIVVLGATLLLSIPTGAGRERDRRSTVRRATLAAAAGPGEPRARSRAEQRSRRTSRSRRGRAGADEPRAEPTSRSREPEPEPEREPNRSPSPSSSRSPTRSPRPRRRRRPTATRHPPTASPTENRTGPLSARETTMADKLTLARTAVRVGARGSRCSPPRASPSAPSPPPPSCPGPSTGRRRRRSSCNRPRPASCASARARCSRSATTRPRPRLRTRSDPPT